MTEAEITEVTSDESDWPAFDRVLRSRRSVRKFTDQPVDEQLMQRVLDAAVLAPNSSNLQPFEFVWVRSPEPRARLVKACLSQSAARTATELVVCVARWDRWRETCDEMATWLQTQPNIPRPVSLYYEKLAPALYRLGPLGLEGRLKGLGMSAAGLLRASPRGPVDRHDMRLWAVKSCALACENMMLAARAQGLDSCPMEGQDPVRVGRLVGLSRFGFRRSWDIPMVIAFGYRDPQRGLWGAQWRRERHKLVREL